MPWFEYEGLTPGGTAIAGRVEAADRDQASEDLADLRIEVRELSDAAGPPKGKAPLSEADLVFFNQQLASLAEAGIALDEGLAQLARDVDSPRLRGWIGELVTDLRRGVPIDQAIAAREQGLPLLYSRVIRAGIETGELPATLLNLNHHLRLTGDARRMVWELASYPLLVALLAGGVMSGFFLFVIPRFRMIFEDFGADLPAITYWLIDIGDAFPMILIILGVTMALAALAWRSLRWSSAGMGLRESIILGIPFVGRLYRASIVARFLRSVATGIASGIPLPQSMRLGGDATGSQRLIRDAHRLAGEVEQGHSVFAASQSADVIPPLFGFCVQVAVGRDALPTAIAQLAHSYENRAVHSQAMLRGVLLPLLVIILGGFLFFGIAGMFLPLVSLINAVSGS